MNSRCGVRWDDGVPSIVAAEDDALKVVRQYRAFFQVRPPSRSAMSQLHLRVTGGSENRVGSGLSVP
eukprot:2213188-Lingulodinium_polyedra.AAC.1